MVELAGTIKFRNRDSDASEPTHELLYLDIEYRIFQHLSI